MSPIAKRLVTLYHSAGEWTRAYMEAKNAAASAEKDAKAQRDGASPRTRGDKSGQHVTHDDIIDVACSILGQHPQGMPIAKLGTLMHRETQNHKLPTLLKERYGGLKSSSPDSPSFLSSGTTTHLIPGCSSGRGLI